MSDDVTMITPTGKTNKTKMSDGVMMITPKRTKITNTTPVSINDVITCANVIVSLNLLLIQTDILRSRLSL
jgi:bifunctional N-acetylglucosamine-1-phosphate-uridyltransferase/glucosamine-1-phosphate-acetyltransferase GlmU-like protein